MHPSNRVATMSAMLMMKLLAVALTFALATASGAAFALQPPLGAASDHDAALVCAAGDEAMAAEAAAGTGGRTLRVGVSDSETRLVLPWFIEDLLGAIRRGDAPQDYLRGAWRGL
ncbi:hypothetical protein BKK79_29530 [Cupriavidus sp. USMAA2-4]|uniref:Uncharacterized protein n=1 Tax=Cupriavidus malaysiensis TaxID=367825 RepID=A0ABM6FB99_9BURK|nr:MULTISPECIES: hypothetical protein [Cupriavidus]AOY95828.1 hypothetical protein BKK79_29530 [Cupriavidus sp. USMAA2-4]AOZ03658.1 hypothetical protein BKK81_32095 [Cupriavidus sp. USMAHM13]AOZ08978.1 hypothetical protein BKK80_24255 [Cupriavidus malaysiensis]